MEAIDLGLSVKWADRNLGANSPDEVGTFYAWAETSSKNDYSWETYEDMIDQGKFGPYKESHFKSGLFKIDSGHDAMTLKFGHPCRIPTSDDFRELITNCKWIYTNESQTSGFRIYGMNGNSIYMPAYGMPNYLLKYWSANRCINPQHAEILELHSKRAPEIFYRSRYYGFNIRGVCGLQNYFQSNEQCR